MHVHRFIGRWQLELRRHVATDATELFQNSMVEKGLRWEVVQTRDTATDPTHPRYNAKAALAKTVRVEHGRMVYGDLPEDFWGESAGAGGSHSPAEVAAAEYAAARAELAIKTGR